MTTECAGSSLPGEHYDQRKAVNLAIGVVSRVTTVSSHFESGLARETRDSYGIQIGKANSSIEAVRVKLRRLITKPVSISKPVSQSRPLSK